MKKPNREKYRKRLLDIKARLTGTVEGMRREALEKDEMAPSDDHMADHGTTMYDQDLTLTLVEDQQETIQQIDEALGRIDAGTYGACDHCEVPIAKARLDALPHAKLCLECQERLEEHGELGEP
jgi:DnaK suppressor protein